MTTYDDYDREELARESRAQRRKEKAENRRAFDPDREPEPADEQGEDDEF